MLPQELGARRYLGPKERVSCQGWLRRALISACPLSGGMQPQVGMPGAGPVPLERGQGKADVCSAVCGVSLAPVSSAVPQLPAAWLCPALGLCPGLCTEAQGCGSSSLAPRAHSAHTPQLAPSSFCGELCSRALEARKAACPRRAGCACVFHLCERVSVPVLVWAGRACSSVVLVLLLCCLGAGSSWCGCRVLPRRAQQRELALRFGLRLGRDFARGDGSALLGSAFPPQARSARPSPGARFLMVHMWPYIG